MKEEKEDSIKEKETFEKEVDELWKGKSLEWKKGFDVGIRFVRNKIEKWCKE